MQLKKRRLSKGWSQEQLAEISGLSVRTIQRLEKGEKPGLETLNALAAGFEISSSELQKVSDEPAKVEVVEIAAEAFIPKKWKGFILHLATSMVVITWLLGMNYAFELESDLINWLSYLLGVFLVLHVGNLIWTADRRDPPDAPK
tara:strand:+ start:1381 stop:1815 length:435 start_codon:yes stop_codon:yes gene_type:complete